MGWEFRGGCNEVDSTENENEVPRYHTIEVCTAMQNRTSFANLAFPPFQCTVFRSSPDNA